MLAMEKAFEIRDIADPVSRFPGMSYLLVLLVVFVFLVVLLRLWLLLKNKDTSIDEVLPEPLSNADIAIARIDDLLNSFIGSGRDFKAFFDEMILILKWYLTEEFSLSISAATTDELVCMVKDRSMVSDESVSRLEYALGLCDVCRFADIRSTEAMAKKFVQLIKTFITKSMEVNE